MAVSRLFQPVKLGNLQLKHRIAMAPLTRFRATDSHDHLLMAAEYYGQRRGYPNVPSIYNQEQIYAWKKVTDEVHKKGSFIFLQLWALGRTAAPDQAAKEGITIKSSSAVILDDGQHAEPKEMKIPEIKEMVAAYAQAAKNAMAAGFDGVEIHAANGYLIHQFTQDTVNKRTDEYGGSIENRSRFAVEVTKAVVEAVGPERTGIRLSPFSDFQGMKMKDPFPQFSDLIKRLEAFNLAYVHLVESRVSGNADVEGTERIEPLLDLWKGVALVAGGFKPDSAKRLVNKEHPDRDFVVVFGRYFLSTPDLVFRVEKGIDPNAYNRDTFYLPMNPTGYTDYPFGKEFLATANA